MRHPRHLPIAIVAAAAITLAACGGNDDAAPAQSIPSAESMSEDSMAESMSDDSMAESMSEDSMAETMVDTMHDDSMSESMSEDSMAETMSDDSMTESMSESMSDESMAETMVDEAALAAWQTISITDVAGESFTFADLIGTPVIVETFATWCPNCRSQLEATNAAAAELGDEAHVIALSVETDLSSDAVASYAADNGFDAVRFAVMTPEMLAAIVDAFGQSAANPPSTPKFVIDAMGHAGELTTGSESADALVAAVRG